MKKSILLLSLFSLVFALGTSLASAVDEATAQVEPDDVRFVDVLPAECTDESDADADVCAAPPALNCTCTCGGTKGVIVTIHPEQHGEKCKDVNGRLCYDSKNAVYSHFTGCK